MRVYSKVVLHKAAPWNPEWTVMDGPRHQHEFAAPKYAAVREDGDCMVRLRHVASGEEIEVPVANVASALLAKPQPPQAKGVKR